MTIVCPHCNKQFSNNGGLATHSPYCNLNPNKQNRPRSPKAGKKKGTPPWNKGLTKEQHPGLEQPHRKGIRFGASLNGHTQETKSKLSLVAKERKLGGYNIGSGRGKKGWFKGYFCDSSWELAYIIWCLDHNKDIKRNTEKRFYEYDGQIRLYIPDFIVDGVLIEIKGYRTKQWQAKLISNPDIKVLYEDEMKPIIKYVIDNYGKDYIKLYE